MSEWVNIKDRLPDEGEYVAIIYNSICEHCKNPSPVDSSRIGIGWIVDTEDNIPTWSLIEPHADIDIWTDQYEFEGEKYSYKIEVSYWMYLPKSP